MTDESRIERALRQGPPFRTHYVQKAISGWSEPDADARLLVAELTAARAAPRALILLALLLLGLLVGGIAVVGSGILRPARPAVWTVTGSMVEAHRIGHTATLLPDGRVLAVGGGQNFSGLFDLATAELYDPRTGRWTSTAPMTDVRWGHTATLLPNGTVLVAGGQPDGGGSESWASAVLFDPSTGTWEPTAPMLVARTFHTATLLPSGQVLVSGGYNTGGPLASAELYDPDLGTWTATGEMGSARVGHAATLLPDGHVLVAGSGIPTGEVVASAELYDPSRGTWSDTGSMAEGRAGPTATLLPDGRVLIVGGTFGGFSFSNALASAEIYDPAAGVWKSAASMHTDRQYHTATLLRDGTVLVTGGTGSQDQIASAEVYDPGHDTWNTTGDMHQSRAGHSATLLQNGTVLVTSGTAEVYGSAAQPSPSHDPSASSRPQPTTTAGPPAAFWTATGPTIERTDHTATLLSDGMVLVAGGYGPIPDAVLADAVLFDPVSGSWIATTRMNQAHGGHTATLLQDGRVLVAGGGSGSGSLTTAELYDPVARSWTTTGQMIEGRGSHTATLLADGSVLVAGGCCDSGGSFLTSAELFDPTTGTWSATGAMTEIRANPTATLLPDGRVLVTGGQSFGVGTAELYNPITGTWTTTASMAAGRIGHTATVLADGRVLVAGGYAYDSTGNSATMLASAELYDPDTGSWTTTGSLIEARQGQSATLLPDGTVLVAGGQSPSGNLASAELYDPISGTWTATAAMIEARYGHRATLLLDGQVLVADGGSTPGSAELYEPGSGN